MRLINGIAKTFSFWSHNVYLMLLGLPMLLVGLLVTWEATQHTLALYSFLAVFVLTMIMLHAGGFRLKPGVKLGRHGWPVEVWEQHQAAKHKGISTDG